MPDPSGAGEAETTTHGATTTSGDTSSSSGTGSTTVDEQPACESATDEAACAAVAGDARRCLWLEVTERSGPPSCDVTVVGKRCIETAYQGEGCGYSDPPYPSCEGFDGHPFPPFYREEDNTVIFVPNPCEEVPVGFTQCWSDPEGEPAACECPCESGAEINCEQHLTKDACEAEDPSCSLYHATEFQVIDEECVASGEEVGWCHQGEASGSLLFSAWYEEATGRVFSFTSIPSFKPEGWTQCSCDPSLGEPAACLCTVACGA